MLSNFSDEKKTSPIKSDLQILIKDTQVFDNGSLYLIKTLISCGENSETKEFILFNSQKEELSLVVGEITVEKFSAIEYAAGVCEAARRGANILSYGKNSASILKLKLCRKGFSKESAEGATNYLQKSGYIDELSDVERVIEISVGKLWGKRKIINHLYEKGYKSETIRNTAEFMEQFDFEENCLNLLKKKYRTPSSTAFQKDKASAFLMRNGYHSTEIKHAINAFCEDE